MNYAAEMGSGAMIYIHNKCYKDWFRLSKFNRGRGIHRHIDIMEIA
jgi:hypothetical protein